MERNTVSMVSIADLLQDPQRVAEMPPEVLPALLGDLERLRAELWARMTSVPANSHSTREAQGQDHLLTVQEAAARLGVSKDWLYRHAARLPFTVRLGPRQLRFSVRGIERWIRQRQRITI